MSKQLWSGLCFGLLVGGAMLLQPGAAIAG